MIRDSSAPLWHFPTPSDGSVGLVVRGHNMGLIKDGWIVLIDHPGRAPTDAIVDQLCVVKTTDDRVLVRYPRKGRKRGAYDLLTATGTPELDVELVWAEPVTWIRPHVLTGNEIELLNQAESAAA